MRVRWSLLSALAVTIALAATPAAGAHDTPQFAKLLVAPMVSAHDQCTVPTLTHRTGPPASGCVPGLSSANHPADIFSFGPLGGNYHGAGRVGLRATSGDVKLYANLSKLWRNGAPHSGEDLTAQAIVRITDNGCGAPPYDDDCTVVDLPLQLSVTCSVGSCRSTLDTLNETYGLQNPQFRKGDRMNIEVGPISFVEPDGDVFLREGLAARGPRTRFGFDAPRSSAGMRHEMVTAYNPCDQFPLPHTHRPVLALPACVPVLSSANDPTNVYSFGPRGSARASISMGAIDARLNFFSRDIWKDGAAYSGNGLTLATALRVTDSGCGPAPHELDCTRAEIPFPASLTCVAGSCTPVAPTLNGVLPGATHPDDGASIEFGQLAILDEDGDAFARRGILVR